MHKKSVLPILFLSCGLLTLSVVGLNNAKTPKATFADAGNYYSSIDSSWTGKKLLGSLHDLITKTHTTYTTYNDNGSGGKQKQTDQYYDSNNNPVSGYIFEFYSGAKWNNAWKPNDAGGYNREHVWPQANSNGLWGQAGGGADMHHLRPTECGINSTRGNSRYGELSNRDSYKAYAVDSSSTSYLGGYCNGGGAGNIFEPIDSKKGDVARIVMYVYTHYNSYNVTDVFGNNATTNGSGSSDYFAKSKLAITKVMSASSEDSAFDLLLKWNKNDPVDYAERQRNEKVYGYQGNRNPFIDNPGYAEAIWGNGSSTSQGLNLNKSELSLGVGGIFTLKATDNDGVEVKNVSWSISDPTVASISSAGRVEGLKVGSATITASGNGTTATCKLKIMDSSGGDDSGSSGCGGSIIAPSIIVFSATILGLGLVVLKKKSFKR